MIDMVEEKKIIPAVMEYTTTVAKSVAAVKAVGADASVQEKVLKENYNRAVQTGCICC